MRLALLLMLVLSLPTNAAVQQLDTPITWHVSLTAVPDSKLTDVSVGSLVTGYFVTQGDTITSWEFLKGAVDGPPLHSVSPCTDGGPCSSAAFVNGPCQVFSWHCDPTPTFDHPTYILFSFLSSPYSTAQLQLELDGPLSTPSVRAIGSVFGHYSNFIFHGAGTVAAVPEPTQLTILGMTLGLMLIVRLLGCCRSHQRSPA